MWKPTSAVLYPPDPTLDAAAYDAALDNYRRRVEDIRDAEAPEEDDDD